MCKHVQFDSPNLKIHQFWVKYIWNIFRFIEDLERISSRLGPVIRSTTDFNTQICIQDEIGFSTPLKKNKGKTKLFISPAPNKNVAEHKLETATNSEEKDELSTNELLTSSSTTETEYLPVSEPLQEDDEFPFTSTPEKQITEPSFEDKHLPELTELAKQAVEYAANSTERTKLVQQIIQMRSYCKLLDPDKTMQMFKCCFICKKNFTQVKNLYEHLRKSCKIVKNPLKQTNLPKNSAESWRAVDELSEQGELVFNNMISDPGSSSEPLKHVDNISRKKKQKTDFSNILSGIEPLSSSEEENTEKSQSHETSTKPEEKTDLESETLQEEDLSTILPG